MNYRVRYTKSARDDLARLYSFLADRDLKAASRARKLIAKSMEVLREFPFTCRKAMPENAFLRELVIGFGSAGYVALFEIENDETITVLAVRHQREDDYF